ncbi:MAG: ABC transporter ATP-binding protein [Candidatus Cohnella colombiensis]|uniref:ABC transporter ATP-binding protein n=1 Tax=Candidatus Cohnella colombiensis TaxID=3121368 RepID=A0AA95F0B3_9BACL|nr:MAG: ABC transporter ATP-binding protein [Cohnella sp.]
MSYIQINNLTKDYGDGRGIFDLNLEIEKGEVFGFVGTNGAGKTTTIRHMMGFLKPQNGTVTINGMNGWTDAAEIKKLIGYIPGEIAFPDAPTGTEFLKRQAELLGLTDMSYAESIIKMLQLDPTANLKRMSKGMKQKTAIVAALMADPDILILDEPTTGLDPLMRAEFVKLLNEEKRKGKTIFMSSHMFEEVEHTCDKVALIKGGKLIAVKRTSEVRRSENKQYKIEFITHADYVRFLSEPFKITTKRDNQNQVFIQINDADINLLFRTLTGYPIKFIKEIKYTLESYFKGIYEEDKVHA